jgi:cytochrome c-type biogenesis protein CcmH/NrfF
MWSWLVVGVVALGPQVEQGEVAPRFPAAVETEASKIFNSMMSPFCPGLLIANCPSPGAADLKEQVKIQLAGGVSPDSVRALLRVAYGDQVDAVPPAEGFGLLAWIMPGAALLGGGVVVVWWLRRRGSLPARSSPPTAALDADAQARLERELAKL